MNRPAADIPSALSGQDSRVAAPARDNRPPYFAAQHLDPRDEVMLEDSEDLDLRRMVCLTRGRAVLEQRLCQLLDSGNLTVAETLDCLREVNQAIRRITMGMKPPTAAEEMSRRAMVFLKTITRPGTANPVCSDARLEGTTPQGREIVRRKLYGLKKKMLERQAARADSATALAPTPG